MRLIKLLLAFAFVVALVPVPSRACYGEVCDAMCAVATEWNHTKPGQKFPMTCPL